MKKLYFLNEEESNRILNLHKDATKRQYLKEDDNSKILSEQKSDFAMDRQSNSIMNAVGIRSKEDYNTVNSGTNKAAIEGGNLGMTDYKFKGLETVSTPAETTPTTVVQKPVQSAPNPLVMDIQKKLKEKKIYIGNTGRNKDGVDGVMGKKTLNGIISLLGGANIATTTPSGTEAEAAATKSSGELTKSETTNNPLGGEQSLETTSVAAVPPITQK